MASSLTHSLTHSLVTFWFEDLPPMDGGLRIMFYVLIFLNYWMSLYPWYASQLLCSQPRAHPRGLN